MRLFVSSSLSGVARKYNIMSRKFTITQYLSLADLLAKMRMKSQANKLVLSYGWLLIEPLIMVTLFYVVFSQILNHGSDDYFTFMIIGKIVFLWFSKSVTMASNSLLINKGILAQREIPKWIFPLSSVQEVTYKSIIALMLMLVVTLFNGFYPSIFWLQVIPVMLVTYILIIGVSFISAILVSFAQDFSNLVGMAMLGLMFASGIFWDIDSIQDSEMRELILSTNPLATIIYLWREILMHNIIIDFKLLIPSLIISMVFITIALVVFKKFNNKLTRCIFS